MTAATAPLPRSLLHATHIDVLGVDREVARRAGYLVVRSPSNPGHWWGNLLLFDEPPAAGDRERWETLFEREFADEPEVQHRTFTWDTTDGRLGQAREEFGRHGYEIEESVGLIATAAQLRPHPRENREALVRELSIEDGLDAGLWEQVVDLQTADGHEGVAPEDHRAFHRRRLAELRLIFHRHGGGWYVALDPSGSEVRASCGIVVVGDRARFQVVDTAAAHRRRGIASRLLVEAARRAAASYGAQRFVIAADRHYHALALYESLGFEPVEQVAGVCLGAAGR